MNKYVMYLLFFIAGAVLVYFFKSDIEAFIGGRFTSAPEKAR